MFDQPRPTKKLRKGTYYTISNCKNGLALSMPLTNKYIKDKPQFQQWDPNNVNQLWMIEEIGLNKYEIVHAVSTLVLQSIAGSNICKLQFGRQKACQVYYLEDGKDIDKFKYGNMSKQTSGIKYESPANKIMQQERMTKAPSKSDSKLFKNKAGTIRAGQRVIQKIRIKQKQKSRKYLYSDVTTKSSNIKAVQQKKSSMNDGKVNVLKFMEIDLETQSDTSLWEIRQVYIHQNQILSQSCYIQSFRSGFVLDVPEASDRKGVQIIQYPCNFRFNQRWILKKVDEINGYGYYTIKNVKSGLYLDIKSQSTKQGAAIIQWENQESKNQIWRLEQQGKRVYLLRSALEKDLLLGVKQNSVKEAAQIVTSKLETQCFWTIHGFIPE